MFKKFLLSLAFVTLASPVWASGWATGMFDETSCDFGSVPRGTVCTHPFRIVNNTGKVVSINPPTVSCSQCVTAQVLKSTLNPGEETAVIAQLDTRRVFGIKDATVSVSFSQPSFDHVTLKLRANSREDITFSPEGLAFGKIKKGTAGSAQLMITFLGGGTQVTGVSSDSNFVQVKVTEQSREGNQSVYQVDATLRPDTPVGKWFTEVHVRTNNANMQRVRVPASVEVEAEKQETPKEPKDIKAKPMSTAAPLSKTTPAQPASKTPGTLVQFGSLKAGVAVERKIVLRGSQPFRILAIEGIDQTVAIKDMSGDSQAVHYLTVTLWPADAGDLNRTLRVQTDMAGAERLEIQVRSQVNP